MIRRTIITTKITNINNNANNDNNEDDDVNADDDIIFGTMIKETKGKNALFLVDRWVNRWVNRWVKRLVNR